jgi:hypothetical protein
MTPRHLIGQQISQVMAIADALSPQPATSSHGARMWRTVVAYCNERMLGDELDLECAEEKRRQQEEDERLNGRLRVVSFKHWFERWTA